MTVRLLSLFRSRVSAVEMSDVRQHCHRCNRDLTGKRLCGTHGMHLGKKGYCSGLGKHNMMSCQTDWCAEVLAPEVLTLVASSRLCRYVNEESSFGNP